MKCLKSDKNSVELCADLLKSKKIVILPTDTVYGFSGIVDFTADKIRKIKGREESKPFIQLISKKEDIYSITDSKISQELLNFWPGPLTIIVKVKNSSKNVPSETETVAVRCPGDEWLRKVIEKTGNPIYSTSVNRSGKDVLTKINDIILEFEDEVDLIVQNGDSKSSVPSTIINCTEENYKIIREGAISKAEIEKAFNKN